jgi:hypothetical protein
MATTTDDRKGRKEVPPGLEKNNFPGASQCAFLLRSIKRGEKGENIKQLQEYLKSTGDFKDIADGAFGTNTEEAIQKIQTRYKIVSSGNSTSTGYGALGPRTRAILMAHCKALKERRDNGSATSTKPVSNIDKTVAPTCTLTASKSEVESGDDVTLTWVSTNATHASQAGGGKGPAQGSLEQSPTETTTYVKRVYGPGGEGSCTAEVVVEGDTSAPEEKVVRESALDRVFSSAGQSLAAAITAYFGLFGVEF